MADVSNPPTIGIVSPFTSQIECLQRAAQDILPLFAYERHQILIATPDAFRGLERDIILCSLAITDDARIQSVRTLDGAALFNLLLTRAKYRAHFFASFNPLSLAPRHVLRRIYEASLQDTNQHVAPMSTEWVERLTRGGYTLLSEPDLMGLQVDCVITRDERLCGCFWLDSAKDRSHVNLATRLAHARHCHIPVFVFSAHRHAVSSETRLEQFNAWFEQYSVPSVKLDTLCNSTV